MDRALDLGLLSGALDDTANLPTPTALRRMLAEAEVTSFFRGSDPLDPSLLETAWNLHQVGTVRAALQIYGAERQVQANAVAAHIFDLCLRSPSLTDGERLVLTFAAQVSSIRGDRMPNASALGREIPLRRGSLRREPGRVSLELGCTFLSLNRAATMGWIRSLGNEERALVRTDQQALVSSPLAAAIGVIEGIRLLQRYLTYGDPADLQSARSQFSGAATAQGALRDLDSRWVAAHLLDLCDDLGSASVWAIIPIGTPPITAMAMTLGDPPVVTLWPPQVALLSDANQSPLRADVKRAVITFPTSAGKTLLTQMIIVQHLAMSTTGVCVVAPSHSLCREIREGLDRRLWVLRKHIADGGPLGDRDRRRAPVVVMTPEKLAARLRAGETELLQEFGLFVLDEAHLVSDRSRGWTFETMIARLHELTTDTDHRIVLVSAALGGTASIRSWLAVDTLAASSSSRWRGPRRLHATYQPREDPSTRKVIPRQGKQKLDRVSHELKGVVELYVDEGQVVARRSAPLGTVIRAGKQKEAPRRAEQLRPIVELAAASGSVLTVHARKKTAEDLAAEIAAHRPEKEEASSLRRLAELRLGPTHPLVGIIGRGIAYHHAALPADVQAEIEAAIKAGIIDIVCSTTTLTEGLNLPVRTVIVCDRGYPDGSGFELLIDAAGLLNAAGRAGRAGRQTEGWVIVAAEPKGPDVRAALRSLDEDRDVSSVLNSAEALAALGEYEALLGTTAGVVLADVPVEVDGFLSYCWYLADAAFVLDPADRPLAVIGGIRHTLAWQQLDEPVRARWEALARRALVAYEEADSKRRRRWARTGTGLSANAVLEQVASSAGAAALEFGFLLDMSDPLVVLEMLLGDNRLNQLLELIPDRDRRFKRRRYGATQVIDVDLKALVLDWVRGRDLIDLANTHLSEVEGGDEDAFRFEQLSSFLTRVCEHHLPWTLGIVLEWVEADTGLALVPELPAFIHFGVDDLVALELMRHGVRSRRLAVAVAKEVSNRDGDVVQDVRSWISRLGRGEWRSRFEAGAAEVAELLQFVHDPTTGASAELLNGGSVSIEAGHLPADALDGEEVAVEYLVTDEVPRPLGAIRPDGQLMLLIPASEHHHLAVLLDAGFRLSGQIKLSDEGGGLVVRVEPE